MKSINLNRLFEVPMGGLLTWSTPAVADFDDKKLEALRDAIDVELRERDHYNREAMILEID